ncbi:DM4/DM12 family [Nesidiocoris tenuis]|uniref:DM4/DM12 family n=1 Tax=Nesidiocoris tenuis TaxID=355587 RepID=A0ABN7BGS3_9HEMI|nr:DM4/DM12 family [Nesidiocoris tenuis]
MMEENDASRSLVFWNGGTIKFVLGWSIPLPLETPFVTLFTHTLQMAYPTISNATMLTDLLQQGLAKGIKYTKRSVYYLVDRYLSKLGSFNKNCFTRAICEFSQLTIGHGLAADIFQHIFQPEEKGKYRQAWERGKEYEDCEQFYYCPYIEDMLSHFTVVQYV